MPLQPDKCYVIAEIGSNHLGNMRAAADMIVNAAAAGADAAKFQLFRLEDVLVDANKGDSRTEMSESWLPDLASICKNHNIDFLCTPFAPWAVEALDKYVEMWKVGSFEAKNDDLWTACIKTRKPIVRSCGRYTNPNDLNTESYGIDYPLYCVSKYPASPSDIYLPTFDYLTEGFSDHTTSTVIPALAVARGARIIEKHVRLEDTPDDSPDYPHSLTPSQFAEMVRHIRLAELTCWRQPPESQTLEHYANRREVGADGSDTSDMGRPEDSHGSLAV